MPDLPTRLAIVTGEIAPDLSDGGQRLASSLAAHGIESEPVLWNDPSVDWATYDAVLLRSCWDYPDDRQRFRAMLEELAAAPVRVCNPLPAIRWNLHKRYLTDLAAAGVTIPETTLVDRRADVSLDAIFERWDHGELVVKPAIGAMSTQVWRTSATDGPDAEARFSEMVAEGDVVVQAFVPEIETGERSAVFFGGEYSHAWNSLTEADDVTAFDGIDADYEPTAGIRAQAADALRAAAACLDVEPAALPYARVDYVPRDGDLVLMELELIEPFLGFDRGEIAVERFTDALVSYFEAPPASP